MVTAVLALFHWRPPVGLWFLAGGLTAFVVADLVYLFHAANGTYQPGGLNDSAWVLATLLMAFAPGWPRRPAGRARCRRSSCSGIPVGASLVAVSLLVFANSHALHPVAVALAAGTIVAALGPPDRHLPRGADARAQPPARPHRRADRAGQPARVLRAGRRRGPLARRRPRPARSCCWTWTGSRRSTTAWGTTPATTCCCHVAARLSDCLHGRDDLLARLGGDEFAFFLVGVDPAGAEAVAQRIHAALAPPFNVDARHRPGRRRASGSRSSPSTAREVPTLLRRADIAMYHAKERRSRALVLHAWPATPPAGRTACGRSRSCATPSSPAASSCTTSRRSTPGPSRWAASRRWCAGTTRPVACSSPTRSCRSPSSPA